MIVRRREVAARRLLDAHVAGALAASVGARALGAHGNRLVLPSSGRSGRGKAESSDLETGV